MKFELISGTDDLTLGDVAHLLVPGRGRDSSGFGINREALDRVVVACALYESVVRPNDGRIVCSGYKSPVDMKGSVWSPPDALDETFLGMPEADIMRSRLIEMGVDEKHVYAERHSIDTVTNFLRAEHEGHFGDSRPVAIVAQAGHLQRMLAVIAPRTLRRSYLGVVVPEESPRPESRFATIASTWVSMRLPSAPSRAIATAHRRATGVWRLAQIAGVKEYPLDAP